MSLLRSPPTGGLSTSDPNINSSVSDSSTSTAAPNVTMRSNFKRIRLDDSECTSFDLFKEEMMEMLNNWKKQQDLKLDKLDTRLAKFECLEKGLTEIKTGIKSSNR
ncbi:hypothetical protein B5X24_HaOG217181 [Helicoverpa armigera]|uniref:Uncharacterized protein n=1 Tax=Helicoverpa armigera TaxID=29058 RepID=A0A2W1B1Q0_HELAM|nr:hypothetical protein B5X24_HaOG217181 [Helicoverpa armigera]